MNAQKRMECLERMRQARQRAMEQYIKEYRKRQEFRDTEQQQTRKQHETLPGKRLA